MLQITAQQYIDHVLDGTQPACAHVRAAVQRHVDDLANADQRGLYFDETRAKLVIAFFSLLKHSKGEWAGMPVVLEPWQQFVLWCVFGWMRDDGTRRFRTVYLEVGRKNGKTTLAAGIGLYLLVADNEPGAEIYTAATKLDQAVIAHSEATRMVKSSAVLRQQVRVYRNNLHVVDTASKFEPLGRDADSLDGLNVSGAICDEIHAWRTRELWDVLETATSARRSPLLFAITTAGSGTTSLCAELHDYAIQTATGVIEDDTFYGLVYTLDEGDDWQNPDCWIKSNPNLHVSKKLDDMTMLANRAAHVPARQTAFMRLHCNLWVQAHSKWLDIAAWRACGAAVDAHGLAGRTCYAGLDLSSTTDITALVLVFPPVADGDAYQALCRFFIPDDSITERSRTDRVPYDAWLRSGHVTATPGNVIDYDHVLAQLDADAQLYDLAEIAFDRWGASRLMTQMADHGHSVIQFGQGFASMSPPMKELEKIILSKQLAHGDHPVLTWMADNLVARTDPAGNIKPDKERSREKIDGMVALIMALDRAVRAVGRQASVYDDRGLRTL
jgi:phage terminase large subunit-like protein